MMGWMSLWMLLALIVFVAVVAAAVYVAVQLARGDEEPQMEGAKEVLDRRLASGEISAEEYFERESALRGSEQREQGR
jgi:uncharacterized membrane protein